MTIKKCLALFLSIAIAALIGFFALNLYRDYQLFSINITFTADAGSQKARVVRGILDELVDTGYQHGRDFAYSYAGDGCGTTASEVAWLSPQSTQGSPDAIVALGALAADAVISAADEQQVPVVFVAFSNPVNNPSAHATGILASTGVDKYELGRQVGKILVRIMRGEKPSAIPVSSMRRQNH